MKCPKCNRILSSALSICPSCGTMMGDSVREELAIKVSSPTKTATPTIENKPILPIPPTNLKSPPTSEIMTKATSPTLVDFQNKNAMLPDWRLQLQNSVRKRLDKHNDNVPVSITPVAPRRVNLPTNGATALKIEAIEEITPNHNTNPTVESALKRIEQSRQRFLMSEAPPVPQNTVKAFPVFPNKPQEILQTANQLEVSSDFVKPNIVPFSNEVKVEKFDTNKLPPLPLPAKISSSFEKRPVEYKKVEIDLEYDYLSEIQTGNKANGHKSENEVNAYSSINPGETEEILENQPENEEVIENEAIEDCAPLSLRFNAGLFDLLICSFLSLILLSPFMLVNGRFFSAEGFFAFLATCSIVAFIYMTTTIGFLGRTFGMRLFSLEIVDAEESEYPTLHQAAVSSSIYLLSLGLGGIGFLTMFLNTEKRAAHDLISGTIIVKEY